MRDAAAEQRPEGDSNLGNAVLAAVDDFADSERFPDPDSPKRVLVFTGTGEDECLESAPDEIRRELERTGIDAVFKLVAVKVSLEDRDRLMSLKDALGQRAEVVFADTPQELEEAAEPEPPEPDGAPTPTETTATTTTTGTTTTTTGTTTTTTTTEP